MHTKKYLLILCVSLLTVTPVFAQSKIDYTDLDHAICIHNKEYNDMIAGVKMDTIKIDYGPGSNQSCHTVHTDITEYNAHTNYLLRCTTPDGRPAVRLGNLVTGGDASRVVYTYVVDANSTILVLDYAAVLEDPGHSVSQQPKFMLELFDGDGNPLVDEHNCSNFNFIAGNTTDGWNTVDGKDYLWKDWTTMGVNLRPYIGQQIKVQLTVFDCQPDGHFGYAYYALSVQSDQMKSTICGALEETVTFTAPDGFDYVWYVEGTDPEEPENVLSVDQYFIHDTRTMPERTYNCDVLNTENPDCKFTLSATPKDRFPLALFDVDRHTGVCADTLFLTNRSGVSSDNIHLNDPYEPCDNIHWDFGDGRTMDDETPEYIVFTKPGTYDVALTVGLDAWTCSSEKTDNSHKIFTVTVGEVTSVTYDTICYGDTLDWHDKKLFRNGTYVDTIASCMGCDSICTLHLSYYPQYDRVSREMYMEALESGYDMNAIWPGIFDPNAPDSWDDPYMLGDKNTIEHDTICEDFFVWPVTGKTYTETNFYIESIPTDHNCDSLVFLDLRLKAGYVETKKDTIQLGETYHWENHVDLPTGLSDFTLPGEYHDTLPDLTRPGCDSVFILRLTVELEPDTVEQTDTICYGSYFEWVDHDPVRFGHLTEDSTYNDTLISVILGVDSVYSILHLKVLVPEDKPVEEVTICANEPYTWVDHTGFVDLKKDSTYHDTLHYAFGCDSLYFTLRLHVLDTVATNDAATVCSNELPYEWKDGDDVVYTFTTADWQNSDLVKEHRFTGSNTCDSVVTFTLTVLDTIATTDAATVCSNKLPYNWMNGTDVVYTFTTADWQNNDLVKEHRFTGSNTCDSVVTFTLTVKDTMATTVLDTICSSELPYEWRNGTDLIYTFTETDWLDGKLTQLHTFEGYNTCDSVVTYQLTVHPSYTDIKDSAVVCENGLATFSWEGETFDTGHLIKTKTLTSSLGCDSTVTFKVILNDAYHTTDGATICSTELPYEWKNGATVVSTFTEADYEANDLVREVKLDSKAGCDSIVNFTLVVHRAYKDITDGTTVCSNELPYTWETETFTQADYASNNLTRTLTLKTVNNCDSIVTFTLTVNPSYKDIADGTTICSNELPYTWETETFTQADYAANNLTRTLTLKTVNNCDSIVTFTLTVNRAYKDITDGATVCSGELPYTWEGETFTQADFEANNLKRTKMLKTVLNCDSIVTFTLTVNRTYPDVQDGATICQNELPYTWETETFTQADYASGNLTRTLTLNTKQLCDSVVTFTLTVNPSYKDITDGATVCQSELPYTWETETFTQADYTANNLTRTKTLKTAADCDSVVTFTLTVNPSYSDVQDGTTICETDLPYTWEGEVFTLEEFKARSLSLTKGRGKTLVMAKVLSKTKTLKTVADCDSVVTFTLTVNPTQYSEESYEEERANLPYMWNGIECKENKDYEVTLTSALGCDSIVTLHFTIHEEVCHELVATLTIDTACANQASLIGHLNISKGEPMSYSIHYKKKDPYGRLQDLDDVPFDGSNLAVPFVAMQDTTKYIRPDAYPFTITFRDTCDQTVSFDLTLQVLYPSWIMLQRWNDVIALYNERYNGGYRFAAINWYHEGQKIAGRGEHGSYIYVEGDDSQTLDFGTRYWAGLVREGETEEICTCVLKPEFAQNATTRFGPMVTLAQKQNSRELDINTDRSGTYQIYDVSGRYLGEGKFGPDYQISTIILSYQLTAGTYILVFQSTDGDKETHKVEIW